MVVEVAHGDGGEALADAADQSGGGQRGTTQGEEVSVDVVHRNTEGVHPQLRQPLFGRVKAICLNTYSRQRPWQRLLVHLAGGANRQLIHDADARDEGCRHGFCQAGMGCFVVETSVRIIQGNVANEYGLAARRLLHGHRGVIHVRQCRHVGFDLTELDAAATNLHLVIDTAHEVQAVLFQAYVVTGAVGTLPTHGLQRRVLLRVLDRVQVGSQAYTTNDEFAHLTDVDGFALLVDDHQVPTIQRQSNRYWFARLHVLCAGHDGGLGGAVGVPHLALFGGQAVRELLGAGFAADDEEADIIQGLGRPETGQGWHGGHHRDVAANEPGTQVHTGAHEGTRRRDQAGTVAPGQPHFLTGGVEGYGQARQHAVVRAERALRAIS